MSGPRNRHGCNDAADCYRTIQGVRYLAWCSCPEQSRIAAYRAAGVRVRRQGVELFIHPLDVQRAEEIDRRAARQLAASTSLRSESPGD